jgi:hypothetical protein
MVLIFLVTGTGHTCDTGTVRDAAFNSVRDKYLIGVVCDDSDNAAKKAYEEINTWLGQHGANLNIELEQILPQDAMYLKIRYGVKALPNSLPVTYLSGRAANEARPVPYHFWDHAPDTSFLETIRSNKVLAEIREQTPQYWAAVLYSRGLGAEKKPEVLALVEKWKQTHAPGVVLIEMDRHDPGNALLCSVAGIKEEGEDWAGIVFGRGRLLMPALEGTDINEKALDSLVNKVTVPCTCLQQDMVVGLDLPMTWDTPENRSYAQLEAPVGYMEIPLEVKMESIFQELPSGEKTITSAALTALGALGMTVICFLLVMYIRMRKKQL